MIINFLLSLLGKRNQPKIMACRTPCKFCKCVKESVYDSNYIEIDPSPLATQMAAWLESPSSFYFRDCAVNPDSAHCRIEG